MFGRDWLTTRRVVLVAIVVLVAPTVVAGATYSLQGAGSSGNQSAGASVENLTLVTSQGRSLEVAGRTGNLEILNTTSKEQVWVHDECGRYYDVEPVDDRTVFFTANCRTDNGDRLRLAFEMDWRSGEIDRLFLVPGDTHDIDRLGPHRYVVADIGGDRAYVYNFTADETIDWTGYDGRAIKGAVNGEFAWKYNFTNHYPPYPRAGGDDTGYTHLNDVDSIDDGSAFLLSPRNFNRVVAVNRSTKETEWTLGDQEDTTVLAGQHHPVLLDDDPLTVLVGDSNNHRAVEYQRVDGEWEQTWSYSEGLNWPRAVDRLPNGNTLIMDTGNDRALEVTPNGTVVWEYETSHPNPYDLERYAHGDEPDGPTMTGIRDGEPTADGSSGGVTILEHYHRLAGFVLPIWVGKWEFAALAGAVLLGSGWAVAEGGLVLRSRFGGSE